MEELEQLKPTFLSGVPQSKPHAPSPHTPKCHSDPLPLPKLAVCTLLSVLICCSAFCFLPLLLFPSAALLSVLSATVLPAPSLVSCVSVIGAMPRGKTYPKRKSQWDADKNWKPGGSETEAEENAAAIREKKKRTTGPGRARISSSPGMDLLYGGMPAPIHHPAP